MNENELKQFTERNKEETNSLEYKLRPNFSEIKETIDHIKERMHYGFIETIYAFANTKGGDLYIGIDNEGIIKGVDESDLQIIENEIKKINNKITLETKTIILQNGRKVKKITVDQLKSYEKPQLLNGVLYWRDKDNTKKVKSFSDVPSIYKKEQFYMYMTNGIRESLKEITQKNNYFDIEQFIKGLKTHMDKKKSTFNQEDLKKGLDLLDKIQNKFKPKSSVTESFEKTNIDEFPTIDADIEEFIKIYRLIMSQLMGE